MNKKSLSSRLFALALAVLCLSYISYQAVSGLADQVETIEASLVTVEDKISSEGIFVRSEQPVYGDTSKTMEYLVNNGEKVAKNENIAMFFSDSSSLEAYHEMQSVEDEIKSLQYAYTHLSGGADGTKLDSLISMDMVNITKTLDSGNVSAVSGNYTNLLQLVLRRDGERITNEAYQAQLAALNSEKAAWNSQVGTRASAATAPASGYFVRHYDGWGKNLSPENLDTFSLENLKEALAAERHNEEGTIGGLVQGFEWYFVTAVDEEQASVLRERSTVMVRFPSISNQTLRVNVHEVRKAVGGQALVIFRSGTIEEFYLNARQEEIDIIYSSYSGIKVPKEALRQEEGQWGVYCLVGGITRFRPVQWVYQTDSYYLVEPAESASKGIILYDQIIVGGKDLEKDKVVK